MKRIGTAIAALAFAGSANAYEGSCFEKNNPDLYSGYAKAKITIAEQAGIGDRVGRSDTGSDITQTSYDAWVRGNPDQDS